MNKETKQTRHFARRHYEQIAKVFAEHSGNFSPDSVIMWHALRESVANLFEQDNDRFDRERFLAATVQGTVNQGEQ